MKDMNMYVGLDKDTGRTDSAATPTTREDAERALRDYATGTSDVGVEETVLSGDTAKDEDACEGLCPECAIELALKEAQEKGITPDSPEFGPIFERIFAEGNPDGNVKVTFLGAHKLSDAMPDELREKIEGLGFDAVDLKTSEVKSPFPFSPEELSELVSMLPPPPTGLLDAILRGPVLSPPPFTFLPELKTSTMDRDTMELPGLDELLGRMFGGPSTQAGHGLSVLDTDGEEIEQERREVVQDLASAAAPPSALAISAEGGADMAAALRDIAALARDTYEI